MSKKILNVNEIVDRKTLERETAIHNAEKEKDCITWRHNTDYDDTSRAEITQAHLIKRASKTMNFFGPTFVLLFALACFMFAFIPFFTSGINSSTIPVCFIMMLFTWPFGIGMFMLARKSLQLATFEQRDFESGNFSIQEDIVVGKKVDVDNDHHTWHYVYCQNRADKMHVEARVYRNVRQGDRVYIITANSRVKNHANTIYMYPKNYYYLTPALRHKIINSNNSEGWE